MDTAIKGPPRRRSYDASRRRQKAEDSRRAVVARAGELLRGQGFGTTTIGQVARAAGVSAEFVYKNFGGKPGLVRAIYLESLLGVGDVPAERRSDLAQTTNSDPRELMHQFGRFVTEVSPLASPAYLLIRDAAASGDTDMAALLREVDRLWRRADDGDAAVLELLREPQRGLAAELHDDADQLTPAGPGALALGLDDLEDVLDGERLEVEPVGGVVVGRDGLRVAVDHDRLVVVPQGQHLSLIHI